MHVSALNIFLTLLSGLLLYGFVKVRPDNDTQAIIKAFFVLFFLLVFTLNIAALLGLPVL